jgi:putative nucleotidyltransferase with HDIG domain
MNKNLEQHVQTRALKIVSSIAEQCGAKVYVIGGFVRDIFLERPSKDIDIVVLGDALEIACLSAEKLGVTKVSQFKNFGTAMFKYAGIDYEFVGARKESYQSESRKPEVSSGTLQDDQNRRDFTINALAISINKENYGQLLDPFQGLQDLENKILRTPLAPDVTYSDDPLRMMRAIRFATQLGFKIEEANLQSIEKNSERLRIVSQERITEELQKIMRTPLPSTGFKLLFKTKLLHTFFPEMVALYGVEYRDGKGHKDNFYHTLQVLDNICPYTDNIWLRWTALLHDIAKPPTKRFEDVAGWTFHGHEEKGAKMVPKIFAKLKLPLDAQMRYVQKLVRLHLRPIALVSENATDSSARRLLFEAGEDFDDLMTLCFADVTSKNQDKVERVRRNFKRVQHWIRAVEEKDKIKNFQPPIDGAEIMRIFAVNPCKEVGQIKNAIKDAILEGTIPNEYDAAYTLMLKIAQELGLKEINTEK